MKHSRRALLAVGSVAALATASWWLLRPREPGPPPRIPEPPPEKKKPTDTVGRLRRVIEPLRAGGRTQVTYRDGSSEELESYRRWVAAELGRVTRGTQPKLPAPSGFRRLPLEDFGQVLAEKMEDRRGAGLLVLRNGPARPLLLEVPHSFYDEGTLDIGLAAFVSSGARALLVNTVHRYGASGAPPPVDADGKKQDSPFDVAHAEASFFLSAHAACVDGLAGLEVVQLHGFADAAVPSADLVLSASGSRADPVAPARALERALGIRVAVYPTQIRVLGGTLNRQAHYSIAAGSPFLHAEMSRSLRDGLIADADRMRRFSEALLGSGQ